MAMRSRKIAPESPAAMEEGFSGSSERESGEGCSRESINTDDQAQLGRAGNQPDKRKSLQHSTATVLQAHRSHRASIASIEHRPKSRKGKRFLRFNNSWIAEENDEDASEGADGTIVRPEDAEPSKALLVYFFWLSKYSEEVNFRLMEQFLTDGADVNAATETGDTVIHDVVSNWDVTVAEFLFERGANIHVVNDKGQSPLHLAASTDHTEMVRWLLEKGANLDVTTAVELQTPLHYAARNDSLEALRMLIESGSNYEVCDYKGRTPLHLAAELDRTVAAEHLLSLDPPAECHVVDKRGNHAITCMIRTMPQVAELALDQLHKVATAERKQYFLISNLERENSQKAGRGIKTPV